MRHKHTHIRTHIHTNLDYIGLRFHRNQKLTNKLTITQQLLPLLQPARKTKQKKTHCQNCQLLCVVNNVNIFGIKMWLHRIDRQLLNSVT